MFPKWLLVFGPLVLIALANRYRDHIPNPYLRRLVAGLSQGLAILLLALFLFGIGFSIFTGFPE